MSGLRGERKEEALIGDDSSPPITAIIVTYNSAHVICDCIAPLLNNPDVVVTIVDNDSSDGTAALVRAQSKTVKVIETGSNLGFSKAVNLGAVEVNTPLMVLLNPDARIDADSLRFLGREAQASNAVVGPRIEHPLGRLRIMSAGKFPTVWRMFCHYFGLSRAPGDIELFRGHYLLLDQVTAPRNEVDWITGACMVMETSMFRNIGCLSERWFMYAEDIEFCFRVRASGYRVVLRNDITMMHEIGSSDSQDSFRYNPAWILNLYDFYDHYICRSHIAFRMWGALVAVGLLSRSSVYSILAIFGQRDRRSDWANESRRFLGYSRAVFRKSSSGSEVRRARVNAVQVEKRPGSWNVR